ncbi:MAG: Phosphoglucomutase [Chlamydiae bacterium]|nr:Phosphoglucomutase [Chlamydiota bacterium]
MSFDETTQKNIDSWLHGSYDNETKKEVEKLIKEQPDQATDAFYTRMAFGTGGLRGVMGVGTNRMNEYTVSFATQGLSNYINSQKESHKHSVLIGHDSRHNSKFFTETAAKVLIANGIEVFIYKELRPVPMVSFGCRQKKCSAAIMITASHNPPEYNGYKVYWSDGAQVLPPNDKGIITEVNKITEVEQVKKSADLNSPLVHWVEDELDSQYLDAVRELQLYPEINRDKGSLLNIVYTPIHGAGITMVPKILADWHFTKVDLVKSQEQPDGSFPTVKRPNPEEEEALKLGIEQLLNEESDILLATDPDSDRIGVVARHKCKAVLLTGNEMACLCAYHIGEAMKKSEKKPTNPAFVKTIVTTELFKKIAESHGASCFSVLTGFKYIGELIRHWEVNNSHEFIFGAEESYGYLFGTHARDKDAVILAALICEIALQEKLRKKTLIDLLYEVYEKYGVFRELLTSLVYPDTKETKDKIKKMMGEIRKNPPKEFLKIPVVKMEDYESSKIIHLDNGNEEPLDLPESNVLLFWLEDKTKLVIRPSGTEPKVKIYVGVCDENPKDVSESVSLMDQKLKKLTEEMNQLLK